MEATSHPLASGPGWSVRDIVCTAGPHDPPYEERHDSVCIAVVTHGTFQYRSPLGAAVLAPGAVLLFFVLLMLGSSIVPTKECWKPTLARRPNQKSAPVRGVKTPTLC